MQTPSPHAMARPALAPACCTVPVVPPKLSSLPPRVPSRSRHHNAVPPRRRPAPTRISASPGDGADAAAASAEQGERSREKERKRCLRCGSLYLDEDNPPTDCAFYGHVTGEKGLFSLSPPHQGIDGEWSDKSGVIVYKAERQGEPAKLRESELEGEVELLPGARRGRAAASPTTTASPSSSRSLIMHARTWKTFT